MYKCSIASCRVNRKQVCLVRMWGWWGGFHTNKYVQESVLVVTADQLGKAVVTRSVQKSWSCGEIGYKSPLKLFFLLFVGWEFT